MKQWGHSKITHLCFRLYSGKKVGNGRGIYICMYVCMYIHIQGGPKKRHKVHDTIILQSYVIESCSFQQNVPKEILYMTKVSIWIQQLNILCYCRWQFNYAKTVLPSTPRSIKTYHYYFMNSSMKHWPILIIFGMWHLKKLDANVCSFGHLALRLLLHYLVKCRSRSLTIDNNEFILGSACVSSENYWDHKIIENLLLRLYFKILSRQTEMIHQQRVGCSSHAVTERAVGKWCQRLPLAFVLQKDILSTCWNEDDVMWHVWFFKW